MKTAIVLLLTIIILGVQFNFGLKKKRVLGAIIPVIFSALFVTMSYMENTFEYVWTGIACVAAFIIVWIIGCVKSKKYEKEAIDKMKAKDL